MTKPQEREGQDPPGYYPVIMRAWLVGDRYAIGYSSVSVLRRMGADDIRPYEMNFGAYGNGGLRNTAPCDTAPKRIM